MFSLKKTSGPRFEPKRGCADVLRPMQQRAAAALLATRHLVRRKTTIDVLTWAVPLFVCVAIFHRGLFSWFVQDDFGSLLLAMRTQNLADALRWVIQPLAQGVLRPIPDAFFYIGLYKLAGLHAFPYRLAV